MLRWLLTALCVAAIWAARLEGHAQAANESAAGPTNLPGVFMMPALMEQAGQVQLAIARQIKSGNLDDAALLCQRLIELPTFAANGYYNLGCVQALRGRTDEAFQLIEQAVNRGFLDTDHIEQDTDLKTLRNDPRFKELIRRAQKLKETPPRPAQDKPEGVSVPALPVSNGVAWVSASNTAWDPRNGVLMTFFDLDGSNAGKRAIINGNGPAGDLLRQWWKEGTAAGNRGDYYDNRDADHANMNYDQFPQLTRIEYAADAIKAGANYGPQLFMFHNGVVIGNSSTARTTAYNWRSQTRSLYTMGRSPHLLTLQYFNSKLYMYPEHMDHDPGHNGQGDGGYGDVFPANTPYVITTQGSSGSERVFLNAMASALAAFRPEVKGLLTTNGLLMPALQMVFRMSNKPVTNAAVYLTGAAHPSVFDGAELDVTRMVKLAHAIARTNVPPLAILKVEKEDTFVPGLDYFAANESETLFDTPCAVARVWRSLAMTRRMVASAAESRDANNRKLTFTWVVLRGDPAKVKITPLDRAGTRAAILLTWQGRQPIKPGAKIESNRIDIGVFAHNGSYYSAPSFITFYTLDNEERIYDAQGRIREVTYTGADEKGNYVDPLLDAAKSWRDVYRYNTAGKLSGWTRSRTQSGITEEFAADGMLIVRRDDKGNVRETRAVLYILKPRGQDQPPALEQVTPGSARER